MSETPNLSDYFTSVNAGPTPGAGVTFPVTVSAPDPTLARLLAVIVEQNRELIHLGRKQLEISQRIEERFERQVQAQRDEFLRWIDDMPGLANRGKVASEAIRILLGQLIDDLVAYIDDNRDSLNDSDFVRAEMVDRYGQMLSHISAMYGMLKRLATAEEETKSG